MRLKNILILIIIVIIVAVTMIVIMFKGTGEYVEPSLIIGETLPKKFPNGLKPIRQTTSYKDMMLAGLENFYLMPYAAATQVGTVSTEIKSMKFDQSVTARRIREGTQYYIDAYTCTVGNPSIPMIIKAMEETYVDEEGKVYFRNAKKADITNDEETGLLKAKKYQKIEKYDTLSDYLLVMANNPTKMFMYKVDGDTITKESTKPIYDKEAKTYTFKLVLDPKLATTEYMPVIRHMLDASGMSQAKVQFSKLELTVTMWEKGLIKSIFADEEYNIDTGIAGMKGIVKLKSNNYYSYNADEKGMQIKPFREALSGKRK